MAEYVCKSCGAKKEAEGEEAQTCGCGATMEKAE